MFINEECIFENFFFYFLFLILLIFLKIFIFIFLRIIIIIFFNVNLKKIKEQPKKINTIEAIFKIILKIKKIISKQN